MFAYHAIHVFEDLDSFACHLCLDELFEVRPVEDCPDCLSVYLENAQDIGPDNPIILEEQEEESDNFLSESSVASPESDDASSDW